MNARMSEPKPGEVTVVTMPRAEAGAPASPQSAEAASPRPAAAPETAAVPKPRNRRRLVLMAGVPLILAVGGGWFWLNGGRYEETDNAYVQQAKVALSADIAGRVSSVSVSENQAVKAGDVLFTVDPEPYAIALAQAEAALASARVGVEQLKVGYGTANAALAAAQSTLRIRQAAFDRKQALVQGGNASDATLDDVKLALETAQNAVTAAEQQVASATAALTGNPDIATDDHPAVRAALAARDVAQRNLGKTTVVAPADGIVSQVSSLNVGQFIATGTTIATLVEGGASWVEANFKESQLGDIRQGMPATVSVDAYPGVKLAGTVTSIGAATGSEFSLIPAQNATGNWVKVVQRVPVRIDFADASAEVLRTGMSATVTVDNGKTTLDRLLSR